MSHKGRLKQDVEDQLTTLFVCPDALKQHNERLLKGQADQLLGKLVGRQASKDEADVHFERHIHLQRQDVFGPHAPGCSQQAGIKSDLHNLLLSNSSRSLGFSELLQGSVTQPASTNAAQAFNAQSDPQLEQPSPFSSPLVRLLRRVSLWYYYRVMFDPLDQLVQLNSSYELLFQLLTPHQQLSCMADILLVLACPALAGQSGQLDTPLHTATLLSMLKMAQQLAEAEAQLQEQQEQLQSVRDQLKAGEARDQQVEQQCLKAAYSSAAVLASPAVAFLRRCRQQAEKLTSPSKKDEPDALDQVLHVHLSALLIAALQQHFAAGQMVGPGRAKVALQQSASCKAVGALLSQLSLLPQKQLLLWWYAQEPSDLPAGLQPAHTALVAHWLRQCCSALQPGAAPFELQPGEEPISAIIVWVMRALSGAQQQPQPRLHCKSMQDHHHQQQQEEEEREECHDGHQHDLQTHPAEALRQLLDVLLSALQYRDVLEAQRWKLREDKADGQEILLSALHCHCMQLLTQAQQQLPPEVCTLQHSSCSGSGGSRTQQQQQQQAAWRLCCSQVQHNLLLVLQLMKHWQHHNACGSLPVLVLESLLDADFVAHLMDPLGKEDPAATHATASRLTFERLKRVADTAQAQQTEELLSALAQQSGSGAAVEAIAQFLAQQGNTVSAAAAAAAAAAAVKSALQQRNQQGALRDAAARRTASTASISSSGAAAERPLARHYGPLAAAASSSTAAASSSRPAVAAAAGASSSADAAAAAAAAASSSSAGMSPRRGNVHVLVKLQQPVKQLQALICCQEDKGQADVHPRLLSLSKACGFTDWRMLKPPVEITAAVLSYAVDQHPLHLQPYIVDLAQQAEDEVVEQYTRQIWELVKLLGDPFIASEVADAWRQLFNQLRKNLPYLQQQAAAARMPSLPRQGSQVPAAAAARPSTQSSTSPPFPAAAAAAASDDDLSPTHSVLRIRGGACGSSTGSAAAEDEEVEEGQLTTDEGDKQQPLPQQQQEEECQQQSHPAGRGSQAAEQQPEEPTASSQPAAAAFTTQAASRAAAGMSAAGAPGRLHEPNSTTDRPSDNDNLNRRFVLYAGFWEEWLQQRRGPKLAAQGNIQPAAPQDVRAFKPSASPKHFQGMHAAAAVQWLNLVRYARQVAPDIMLPAWQRVRVGLHKLDLPVWQPAQGVAAASGSDSDSSTGIDSDSDSYCSTSDSSAFGRLRPCEEFAALTLLLTTDAELEDVQGYTASSVGSWQDVMHALLELLDDAYVTAWGIYVGSHQHLDRAQKVINVGLIIPLMDEISKVCYTSARGVDSGVCGVLRFVGQALQVVRRYLDELGPVAVRAYQDHELNDPLLRFGLNRQLEVWREAFSGFLETMTQLMHTYVCLARAGRAMQTDVKWLGHLMHVLSSGSCDEYLEGLKCHCIQKTHPHVRLSLEEVAQAHHMLHTALENGVISSAWGVIQRAFNLQQEVAVKRAKDTDLQVWRTAMWATLSKLLAFMCRYLFRANPNLPALPPHCLQSLDLWEREVPWQELLLAFKSIPDAIQSCWFMLHDHDETEVSISMRAGGTYMVYGGAVFRPRRGSNSGGSSSSSSGGAGGAGHPRKATGQDRPGRQLTDPTTGNSSAGSSTDDDSSSSDSGGHCGRGAASPRVKPKRRLAPRLQLDQPSSLRHQFAYHSSDDDAALSSADNALLDAEVAEEETSYLAEKIDAKSASLRKKIDEVLEAPVTTSLRDLRRNLSGYGEDGEALLHDWDQAQRNQQQCQERCRQLLRDKPSARRWLEGCQRAVRSSPAPARSANSCSGGSGSDQDSSDDSSSASSAGFRSSAPGALRGYGELQDPLLSRRQQQHLNHFAAGYKWGASRPWHVERARVLVQRQQVLNRVSALQEACTAELNLLQTLQQELQGGAAARSCNGSSQQRQSQLEDAGQPPSQSACQLLINAVAALIAAGTASALRAGRHTAALAAATGPDSPCLTNVETRRTAAAGSPWHAAGALGCLSHLSVSVDVVAGGAREALQEVKTQALLFQQAQQHLQGLSQPGSTLAVQLLLGDETQQHTRTEGSSIRQLLWEVLQQMKPAACQWYEHGAQHYQQQQQKLGKSAAASAASSTAAASVPECCSVELWSTLCHSIAADLLLVPPGLRDMVGNGWAAGAGRLGDMGADIITSSSSSVAGVAARMLVVQYARAARQKYAQEYQSAKLLGQLLVLQLAAEQQDMLNELQPQSASRVATTLTTLTCATEADMMPVAAAAVAAAACSCGTAACTPAGTAEVAAASQLTAAASSPAVDSSSSSSSSSSQRRVFQPSLLQVGAQLGCFVCPPGSALPWLQLVSRYHALATGIDSQHVYILDAAEPRSYASLHQLAEENESGFDARLPPQGQMLAIASALCSLGIPLPDFLARVHKDASTFYATWDNVPLAAAPVTTAMTQCLLASFSDSCGGQQAVQAGSSSQQQSLEQNITACGYWLHAERLMHTPSAHWQQHLAQQLLWQSCSSSNGVPAGRGSSSEAGSHAAAGPVSSHAALLADLACDWCCSPLQQAAAAGALDSSRAAGAAKCRSSSSTVFGCAACGCAQYCSQACAEAARKVHNMNCWRLQALSADGVCWQLAGVQQQDSSSQPRAFFDLSAAYMKGEHQAAGWQEQQLG